MTTPSVRQVFEYTVGGTYPDLWGKLKWAGSVDTLSMSVELVANGDLTGPFTGEMERSGGVSLNDTESTFEFIYNVEIDDTTDSDTYRLSVRITHADASIETHDLNALVKVKPRV